MRSVFGIKILLFSFFSLFVMSAVAQDSLPFKELKTASAQMFGPINECSLAQLLVSVGDQEVELMTDSISGLKLELLSFVITISHYGQSSAKAVRGCRLPAGYGRRISSLRVGDRVKISQVVLKTSTGKAIKVKGVTFEKM